MQQITYITVDVGRVDSLPPIIPAKQENKGRYVHATVNDKGVPFNMSNATALIRIRKPDNTACVYDEGVSISDNVVVFPLVPQALAAAGMAKGEIDFYNSEADRITTFDFWIEVAKGVVSDAEIVSSDYYNILTAQIAQILSTNTIVKPLGYYATLTALEAGVPSPNPGDLYGVGAAAPYDYYVWDGVGQQWVNNGPLEGAPGTPGATFIPIVYSDGVLAWTNDAGLDNPEPVNITGPVGPPGTGLDILGYYATLEALMTDVTAPAAGDTYGVGIAAPYDIYVWDGVGQQWVNNGQLEGLPGATFTPSVAADGTLSWTNDGGLENPAPVNIKGADGTPGETGPTGPAGPNRITADTDTDLTGVMVGDGENVTAYDADAAREYIGAASKPNLLDNWDFKNPVNQRGGESYSEVGYTVDRWKINNATGAVSITDDGLAMSAAGGACYFCQWLEADITDMTLTLSCIEADVLQSVTGTVNKTLSLIFEMPSGVQLVCAWDTTKLLYRVYFSVGSGESTTISRVKLEAGAVSTIASDPPAGYARELAKCQRYFQLYSSASARPSSGIDCRPVMRIAAPTQGTVTVDGATYYFNSAEY